MITDLKKENGADKLYKKLVMLEINEPIQPEEVFVGFPDHAPVADGFYIHFDIMSQANLVKTHLNDYMIANDSYDPRISVNYPSDLLGPGVIDNITNRRNALGMNRSRYEFWKVKNGFDINELQQFIGRIRKCDTTVSAMIIEDNEHTLYRFQTNL